MWQGCLYMKTPNAYTYGSLVAISMGWKKMYANFNFNFDVGKPLNSKKIINVHSTKSYSVI